MIGRTLSHYKILSEISRGGMGIVYRAVDVKLDREVALKVLPPELVEDPERKRRFVQEAKAAAKLEHPHIGVVHEIDEADGMTFIAMELIRGEQLRDTIAKGPVPLRRALEIATDIAEGLAKAHDEGIVHRDLKPANIMVTEDGHTKIIDFGLAKLVEPLTGEGSDIETLTREGTDPGKVMGTVSYMSPEQARGQKIDHRSDIFSFGIVLHEMLCARIPFEGMSGLDTLHAILNDAAPRLSDLGSNVPGETRFELQHIVDKCLAKEPTERYQTVQDSVIDLRSARRRLESGPVSPPISESRRKFGFLAAAVGIVAMAVIGWLALRPEKSFQEATPVVSSSKPSIAVLLFDNNSGDASLNWLRTALADMLITDLAQSPQVEVLSTNTLYQILGEMSQLDERITSLEMVREVAERGNVETALVGSFVRAGDAIRISVRLQEARTGKILSTERVEGVGEASIFPMVDELTRRIKTSFELPSSIDAELDMAIRDATTSSVEAYRYYAEGMNVHLRGQGEEAIPLFERAVELDPTFAMALARLGIAHNNLNHTSEAEEYGRRALENADHLTLRERLYVEGSYYRLWQKTYDRAIEAYRKAVEIYPDNGAMQNNLALRYFLLERYDDAIEQVEEFIRQQPNWSYPSTYSILAQSYAAQGEFQKGFKALQDLLNLSPNSAAGYGRLGDYLTLWGRLDEALEAFEKAESLRPGSRSSQRGLWRISVLREEWEEVEAITRAMLASGDPSWRQAGLVNQATIRLYHGQAQEALSFLAEAVISYPENTASVRNRTSHLLLEIGELSGALAEAKKAQVEGEGNPPEWHGLFLAALAQARLGRMKEAKETAEEIPRRTEAIPTAKEKRRYHHLLGELALTGGDLQRALEKLEEAQSMLPLRGESIWYIGGPSYWQHVPTWYSLARAHLEAGNEDEAGNWFQHITEISFERIEWPIPYVRSFYFLGKIYENRGEMEKSREYYRRFYEYWKDGDMDRERVEEARKKLLS